MNGLDPLKEYTAGITCYLTNSAYVNTDVEMDETLTPVVNIRNGATVGYKYFNFEEKEYELAMNVLPKGCEGTITVTLDDPAAEPLAELQVPADGDYTELTAALGSISGVHSVFFNFYAVSPAEICEFGSFSFR